MTLATFQQSDAIPKQLKPAPAELLRFGVTKGEQRRVILTFAPFSQRRFDSLEGLSFGSGLYVYALKNGVAVTEILELEQAALADLNLLRTLVDFFGHWDFARLVIRLASGGPDLLQIDPWQWYGPNGISKHADQTVARRLRRPYSAKLAANDVRDWQQRITDWRQRIEQATCPEAVRTERSRRLADCLKAFDHFNHTNI